MTADAAAGEPAPTTPFQESETSLTDFELAVVHAVRRTDGVPLEELVTLTDRMEAMDRATVIQDRVELAAVKHAFVNFFLFMESTARATGEDAKADSFEEQVVGKFLGPAETGKVVRDALEDGSVELARARLATEYACYVLFTAPPPAYGRYFEDAEPAAAAITSKVKTALDREQPVVAAKFLAGYRRAAAEMPAGWDAGVGLPAGDQAAAVAHAKEHGLAGVAGGPPLSVRDSSKVGDAVPAAERDIPDERELGTLVAATEQPDATAASRWIGRQKRGVTLIWSADERANLAKAVETAALVDAETRLLHSVQAMASVMGTQQDVAEAEAIAKAARGGPAELRAVTADAAAGRWHVVRAKVRFMQALARFHREHSGAGYPPSDDPQASAMTGVIDPLVDIHVIGTAELVEAELERAVAELPGNWQTRPAEPTAAGRAVTKFTRNVLGR